MSGSNSYNALVVQDTSWVQGRCIYTTGGYMDVFRISEDRVTRSGTLPQDGTM